MFGNLGEMAGLMKKAKEIQGNMGKIKEELAKVEVVGTAGRQVEVVAKGDFTITKIIINPEFASKENVEVLEDMVLTAVNNALNQIKARTQEEIGKATGGLNIPGLF